MLAALTGSLFHLEISPYLARATLQSRFFCARAAAAITILCWLGCVVYHGSQQVFFCMHSQAIAHHIEMVDMTYVYADKKTVRLAKKNSMR
ncbi:hypothetical protein [Paraburkholderia hayleyella]|uniref:hypothetical protein n=1 Tax=Paraburkholderia hayleyella TaxID=2152889 RepID=UPI00129202AB|nr:hypothetical protein [Paraburkholderia hayleyella]